MMFVYNELKVLLVTIHVGLGKVSSLLSQEKIFSKIQHAYQACKMFKIKNPKIAVAGLNPHAGESGKFGKEENTLITPAIKQAQKKKIKVSGPYPADTLFYQAFNKKKFDIVVCMYHDQGLIPFKLIAFDQGVNMTVGLPIIRTSTDHGTAYDIAKKRIADADSMFNAILTAAKLAG
jgi:4-hydroxythreonine-4-phosphate dehydrogenase